MSSPFLFLERENPPCPMFAAPRSGVATRPVSRSDGLVTTIQGLHPPAGEHGLSCPLHRGFVPQERANASQTTSFNVSPAKLGCQMGAGNRNRPILVKQSVSSLEPGFFSILHLDFDCVGSRTSRTPSASRLSPTKEWTGPAPETAHTTVGPGWDAPVEHRPPRGIRRLRAQP